MTRWRRRRRLGPLGLRTRVELGFALVGVLLSLLLGVVAALMVTRYVNDQDQRATEAQAADNAVLVRTKVVTLEQDPAVVMDELQLPAGSAAVLVFRGRRYESAGVPLGPVPEGVLGTVAAGRTVSRRITTGGERLLVVGVPLADGRGGGYFEVTSLRDVETTVRTLRGIILAVAAATALLGVVLGGMISRRLTRPVKDVTAAAAAIAQGDLGARLSPSREPDLAELARSFNRTASRLEARVRADARFAAEVSHQLRTPITTMLNSLALIQNRRDQLSEELVEPLAMLEEDLQRFRKLVGDLLEISRADAGAPASTEPVVVADLVRRAADERAGRSLTRVAANVVGLRMPTDKRLLEQVVGNLVDNAESHGRGCRQVLVERAHHAVRITVDDAGPGIPAGQRERIFDRFVRLDPDRPGSGLGLAIVARHVATMGGDIRVEDVPEGARFVVELPLR